MNWDDVGDAIQAGIERAANLGPGKVVWKAQDVGAPELPYVAISLGGPIVLGIDYLETSQDLTRERGQEVKLEVRGQREVPLEIEVFTAAATAGRKTTALALCSTILASLVLPSVRQIFARQEVSPFDPGPPSWIPDVPSTKFRGRAVATVRCYMPPPTVAEYVGYIERVSGTVVARGAAAGGDLVRPFDTNAALPGDED